MMAAPKFQKPCAAPKAPSTPALPIVSRRAVLLANEGAGKTPCLTAAHNWIGCPSSQDTDGVCLATGKRCILAQYHRPAVESADQADDLENLKRLVKPTKGRF